MALIPLRDYLSGIEELIDGGQIDEALAHCLQILRSYPKHVNTYRMMGKAYLEAHRYSEASDIFQRVLSTCPDDFVAHIGVSIIREEAGDQDGAIWNMERAFEAQPSNRAVQDELRRLYGKREGYMPPKVRLTRGALARMYAHSDLYSQAISELHGALAEDPRRPDLQVFLAEMYFKTDRETEAMDVCTQLIEKLPYCLYANQVMAEILLRNQREEQAQPFLDRMRELDPYSALVKHGKATDAVPADSVTIEQLILEGPASPQPIPKAWTGALQGADLETYGKEELPDWLSFEDEQVAPSVPPEPEQAKTEPKPEPFGLGSLETPTPQANGTAAEQIRSVPAFSENPSAALIDDQVPDWLREVGPASGTLSSETIEEEPESTRQTDEVRKAPPEEKATGELPTDMGTTDTEAGDAGQISASATGDDDSLSWLESKLTGRLPADIMPAHAAPAEEIRTEAPADDDSLGWLERLAADQGAAEEELLTTPEERKQANPEWAPAEEAAERKNDTLAWLDEMEAEAEKETKPQPTGRLQPDEEAGGSFADETQDGSPPSWPDELSAEATETAKESDPLGPPSPEKAADWLDEVRPQSELAAEEDEEEHTVEPEREMLISGDLSRLDNMDQPIEPADTKQSAWLPEAELAGSQGVDLATPVAALSPRRTARLEAEALAGGQLGQARQALNFGKLEDAAEHYGHLLRQRLMVDDVIADLGASVHRNPGEPTLWQILGDAYMRNNQLREALDCYKKAEDLL